MDESTRSTQRYWDQKYRIRELVPGDPRPDEHWIDIVLDSAGVAFPEGVSAIELGSGNGYDTRRLLQSRCRITALDVSPIGLGLIRDAWPDVMCVCHALPEPLPFPDRTFDLAVAGLSLHYFTQSQTMALVNDIGRILKPGSLFIWRVNAVGDVNYGFGVGDEVEPNLFRGDDGRLKRFFTKEACVDLLTGGFTLLHHQPLTESRYGPEKKALAGLCRRND